MSPNDHSEPELGTLLDYPTPGIAWDSKVWSKRWPPEEPNAVPEWLHGVMWESNQLTGRTDDGSNRILKPSPGPPAIRMANDQGCPRQLEPCGFGSVKAWPGPPSHDSNVPAPPNGGPFWLTTNGPNCITPQPRRPAQYICRDFAGASQPVQPNLARAWPETTHRLHPDYTAERRSPIRPFCTGTSSEASSAEYPVGGATDGIRTSI